MLTADVVTCAGVLQDVRQLHLRHLRARRTSAAQNRLRANGATQQTGTKFNVLSHLLFGFHY